jgi:hypothetical protein
VQRYVHAPLLLSGYKFDLRLYVLVTSFQPLTAFVHRAGFARFSTERYSNGGDSMKNRYIHLCNSSVQKHNTGAARDDAANPINAAASADANNGSVSAGGTKTSLDFLWQRLLNEGVLGPNAEARLATLQGNIDTLVTKTLVAVNPVIEHEAQAFHLFGFDVLLDANLHAWLLEVNAKPSMACGSPLDLAIKATVVADTLRILNPTRFDRGKLLQTLDAQLLRMQRADAEHAPHAQEGGAGAAAVPGQSELLRLDELLRDVSPEMHPQVAAPLAQRLPRTQYKQLCPSPASAGLEQLLRPSRRPEKQAAAAETGTDSREWGAGRKTLRAPVGASKSVKELLG